MMRMYNKKRNYVARMNVLNGQELGLPCICSPVVRCTRVLSFIKARTRESQVTSRCQRT